MSEQQNKEFEDEIDLVDLLIGLWQGKWIIIACTLLALIGGVAFYLKTPSELSGQVEFKALNSDEIEWVKEFHELTNRKDIAQIYVDILSNKLFLEQFTNKYFNNITDDSQKLNGKQIDSKVNVSNNQDKNIEKISLSLLSTSFTRSELVDFTNSFIKQMQASARLSLIEYLQSERNLSQAEILQKLSSLGLQKQIAINLYKDQLNSYITKLNEKIVIAQNIAKADLQARALLLRDQIEIAQRLDLSRPWQGLPTSPETTTIHILTNSSDQPLYMRGYIALKEELRLIAEKSDLDLASPELRQLQSQKVALENRNDITAFVPELIKLNSQIFELENDITTIRFTKLLEQINSPSFSSEFLIQTSSIESSIKQTAPRKIIIILALFAGGFLGVILVFMRSVYRAAQKKLQNSKTS